jgi:replication initiation protein RepC
MKDSPNGKRYGVRDRAGRIMEAYGFDLSPIATRHAEFMRLADEARAERAEMGRLRRRVTSRSSKLPPNTASRARIGRVLPEMPQSRLGAAAGRAVRGDGPGRR